LAVFLRCLLGQDRKGIALRCTPWKTIKSSSAAIMGFIQCFLRLKAVRFLHPRQKAPSNFCLLIFGVLGLRLE
jgi:hypothetical protein